MQRTVSQIVLRAVLIVSALESSSEARFLGTEYPPRYNLEAIDYEIIGTHVACTPGNNTQAVWISSVVAMSGDCGYAYRPA